MTAKTMELPMRLTIDVPGTTHVHRIISSARKLTFVSNHIGFAMVTMTAVITVTKMQSTALIELAHKTHSDVPTIDAFPRLGTVMVMTIAVMVQMNRQNIANPKEEHASVIYSLATMETVYLVFTFAVS